MSTPHAPSSLHQFARAAVTVAAIVFAWTAVATLRITPTRPIDGPPPGTARAAATTTLPTMTDEGLQRAVGHDPFVVSRSAPARAYSLDAGVMDDPATEDPYVAEADASPILPTVQGTAVGANGVGFAMCAVPGGPVLVVRPGDRVGDFTVVSIERTRVLFRDASGRRHTVDAVASPSGAEP